MILLGNLTVEQMEVCGRECWTDPARELLVRTQGAIPLCTECALGKGERK